LITQPNNRLAFTKGGDLELAARVNLANIVRQTHLEPAAALQGTEPFCTAVSVLSMCIIFFWRALRRCWWIVRRNVISHVKLTWIQSSQDSNNPVTGVRVYIREYTLIRASSAIAANIVL